MLRGVLESVLSLRCCCEQTLKSPLRGGFFLVGDLDGIGFSTGTAEDDSGWAGVVTDGGEAYAEAGIHGGAFGNEDTVDEQASGAGRDAELLPTKGIDELLEGRGGFNKGGGLERWVGGCVRCARGRGRLLGTEGDFPGADGLKIDPEGIHGFHVNEHCRGGDGGSEEDQGNPPD